MSPSEALGAIALTVVAAGYAVALARLRRLELLRGAPGWWFGYARDGANLAGAAGFVGAYALAGFPGPAALTLGAATVLAAYLLDWWLGRHLAWRGAPWLVALVTSAAGGALVAARGTIAPALAEALGKLSQAR